MKKLIVSLACALCAVSGLRAQNYAFINSESVFKSLDDYNAAIKQLDDLAAQYRKNVEQAFAGLMKKRVELIKPIQDRVFAVIDKYAKDNALGMIIDRTNNQTLLYYAPELDKTEEIINLLKQ